MEFRENMEKNRLFRGIEWESLERMLICSKAHYKKYKRGTEIFCQEAQAHMIFILLKGRVSIIRHMISGKKNILYEIEEGDVFGEHYFFSGTRIYKYGAQAGTDIEVLEIPWAFFYCFCDQACAHHQKLVQNMLEILSMKEWMTIKKLNIVTAASLKERISTWLLDAADESGLVRLRQNREELADYLGVARPSLSRALMKMQNEKMIEVGKKYIKILDREQLEGFGN